MKKILIKNVIKQLIFTISLILTTKAWTKTPPVVLEKGKVFYEIGLNLDILEDPTGNLTIHDVNRPEWAEKFKRNKVKVPNYGYSTSAFWLRIKIKNKMEKNKWIMTVNPPYHDEIKLFKKVNSRWEVKTTGDTYKFLTKEIPFRSFAFKINPSKNSAYFLRIHSKKSGAGEFKIAIQSLEKMLITETETNYAMGIFFGLVFGIAIYNFFIVFSTKSISYLFYVFYVVFVGLFFASQNGYSHRFLFSNYPFFNNEGNFIFMCLAEAFLLFFVISYLRLYEIFRKIYKFMVFLSSIPILFIILSFILSYNFLIKINNIIISFSVPLIFFVAVYILKKGYRPAKYFLLAFTLLFFSVLVKILLDTGFLPGMFLTRNSAIIGNALEMILLSMGLADRFNYQQEQALIKEKELTENLESSNKKLNIMYGKIEKVNEELEGIVTERTKEAVDAKNKALESEKDVSNLLNNMKQSIFSINKEGFIIPPVSDHSYKIFGENIEKKSIFKTLLKDLDVKSEIYGQFKFCTDISVGADLFQYELVKDSFPQQLYILDKDKKEKSLKISYSPILNKNELVQQIMLVIEDVTELKKLEKEAKEIETASAIKIQRLQEIVSQDKKDFRIFARDVNLNLDLLNKSITNLDIDSFFRAVHTIKGNARIYNLTGLSREIHVLESTIIELKENGTRKESLKSGMKEVNEEIKRYVENYLGLAKEIYGSDVDDTFLVFNTNYIEVAKSIFLESLEELKKIAKENKKPEILDVIKKLEFEKFNKSLLSLQQVVRKISNSLNKKIQLEILSEDIYLDVKKASMLKDSIMHIIQNSCDHGIEKDGIITIRLLKEGENLSIIISDNGKGIEPLAIRDRALDKGIVTLEEVENLGTEEVLALIMRPGFSTKEVATEYSGRGVGLDVVKTNISELGGSITLESVPGKGTTFQIKVPIS